ncbi:Tyrosinase family protein asqI [Lachnellula cervina]|uniref:Tyrosinase family protein asqI n=1 Tax=Lachnellula cervina TaxID=1316786 RepID=A0A7D8UI47_9HELO|nr:Tyrosinase family protein asqI [Lachnellula cervina]
MASQTWFKINIFLLSWLLLILPASSLIRPTNIFPRGETFQKDQTIPGTVYRQPMNIFSGNNNLDGPQLENYDVNSFELWYFDAISHDLRYSITIIFYTGLKSSFPFRLDTDNVPVVGVFYYSDSYGYDEVWLNATQATISTEDNGSSGEFNSGASWSGSPDLSQYHITINSTENDISGTFRLNSRAPAQYPNAKAIANQSMLVTPDIGWSNAVPDADSIVDFTIRGREIEFKGLGYHDNKWSNQPFNQSVNSWYWGHGRLGNYSIVWSDCLSRGNNENQASYLSQDNSIISSSNVITVRPNDTEFPPTINGTDPAGFTIVMGLPYGATLNVNVTLKAIVADFGAPYSLKRWLGSMEGNITSANSTIALLTGGFAMLEQYVIRDITDVK